MSEYDVPGLAAAGAAFAEVADTADRVARAVRRLREEKEHAHARLPVDLADLDRRLRHYAGEVDRSARFLSTVASKVSEVDRRVALEMTAGLGLAGGGGRATSRPAERPAGTGIGYGDRGGEVRALQRRLAAAGHDPGPVDGIFGPLTLAALRAYQRGHRLEVTGRTDLATATALLNEPTRGPAGCTRPAGANGRLPASELASVGDGERMFHPAARAFRRMDAAARAAGLDLHVTSGYRTYQEQAVLYERHLRGEGARAAPPGRSTHGLGFSADVDVTGAGTLAWLRRHAGRHGFVEDVADEPWHWTWHP